MRSSLVVLASILSLSAFAGDGYLGTKPSPVAGPIGTDTGGVGAMPFLQMLIALGIVLVALKFVMPKLVTKLNKKIVTKAGSSIQIEESAAFAGGSLYIVRAKTKTLLLSVTSSGVACLADLSGNVPNIEAPTFQEMVDKEMAGPVQPLAVVEASEPVDPVTEAAEREEALAALQRLSRLTG